MCVRVYLFLVKISLFMCICQFYKHHYCNTMDIYVSVYKYIIEAHTRACTKQFCRPEKRVHRHTHKKIIMAKLKKKKATRKKIEPYILEIRKGTKAYVNQYMFNVHVGAFVRAHLVHKLGRIFTHSLVFYLISSTTSFPFTFNAFKFSFCIASFRVVCGGFFFDDRLFYDL